MRLGIVGGGVGGLAAAIALRQAGHDVIVFERAVARPQGAALILWANALKALRRIGLADAVRAISGAVGTTEVRTAAGELLTTLPIAEWSERSGDLTVVTPRPGLIDLLREALPDEVVRTGVAFTAYEHRGERVVACFDDGSAVELDGLVGADGLHSRVRAQLLGDGEPRTSDHDAWVGVAPVRPDGITDGITTATIGRGPRFWSAPLPGGATFWYATHRRREGALATFASWHAPIGELIAATPAERIIRTAICDRKPIARWGDGAVTLLGDAAHPSTPDLGQGACQALESAIALADAVAASEPVAASFRAYERRRASRTATISRLCWLTATNSTVENPTLCAVRDATIRFGLRTVARSQLEWILGSP